MNVGFNKVKEISLPIEVTPLYLDSTPSKTVKYIWKIILAEKDGTYHGSASCPTTVNGVEKLWSNLGCSDEQTAISILREHCKNNSK